MPKSTDHNVWVKFSDEYSPISTSHFAVITFIAAEHVDWLYLYGFYILDSFKLLGDFIWVPLFELTFQEIFGRFVHGNIHQLEQVSGKQSNMDVVGLNKLLTESVI